MLFPSIVELVEYKKLKNEIKHVYGIDLSVLKSGEITIGLVLRDGKVSPKSSAFIRLIAPLSYMHKKYGLNIILLKRSGDKKTIKSCDLIILQRTALDTVEEARLLISTCKAYNTKLVFDTDDSFHTIDRTHPEYDVQVKRLKSVKYIEKYADEAWFSTKNLAYEHTSNVKQYHIFPNTVDNGLWDIDKHSASVLDDSEPLTIIYMGTATHGNDVKLVLDPLKKLASKYPGQFKLAIIGIGNDIPKYEWISRLYQPRGGSLYPRFVSWFQNQGPFDIGIAPLVDSEFNRSKSDIKCLDYLAAGIDPVVSDVTAYKTPELTPFITRVENTPEAWEKALRLQIKDKIPNRRTRNARMKKARQYITNERSTEVLADKMYERIVELTNRK